MTASSAISDPNSQTQIPKGETDLRLITSRQNRLYKLFKALTQPHTRKKHGAFLLEGVTFVTEAVDNEAWTINPVALTPDLAETERGQRIIAKAQRKGIRVVLMAPALLHEIAPSKTPQGVVAVVHQPPSERLEQLTPPKSCTVVVLESLQDPTNVGAVLRIADAVGAFAVLYTKGTADPYAPKAVRASAGSILRVPVLPIASVADAYPWLKKHGFQIVVTVPHGSENCFTATYNERVAIVVGNEARGVSTEAKTMADLLVTIPMVGRIPSLNVAVATGVLLYELLRRQRGW